MDENHKLGLYVSYFLARYNESAYKHLNFGNQGETHLRIGEILSVNPNTVKNWRDEFDPLFSHRVGWYQRPLSSSRVQVANALSQLSESEIRIIVNRILSAQEIQNSDIQALVNSVEEEKEERKKVFILRTPTGRKAEEYFIDHYGKFGNPVNGELKDTRDLGCGYDFEISKGEETFYIEVKGISLQEGGILFTNKEWEIAKEKGEQYYIALVSDIHNVPKIRFINNPYKVFTPKETISTVIQVNWSVHSHQIKDFL